MEKKQNASVRMFWMKTLSPLHVGTGRGVDYIDLPIAREKVSNWPFVPGSAIKGVVADFYGADVKAREKKESAVLRSAFGTASQGGDDTSNAGALIFTDAHLLCLPVQSLFGTFAWCTSPLALARFLKDAGYAGYKGPYPEIPNIKEASCLFSEDSKLLSPGEHKKIYLQDLDLPGKESQEAGAWADCIAGGVFAGDTAWQKIFKERFVILPEDVFSYLCEMGTQVDARIRIEQETKTVKAGALWYEESLPCDTILSGFVWCDGTFHERDAFPPKVLLEKFCSSEEEKVLQIGGKASIGRGRVTMTFEKNSDEEV
jgi:CRISPR-associated protein Cmr4